MKNYLKPDSPRFSANYSQEKPIYTGQFAVVSYNIHFGENVEKAIKDICNIDGINDIDVLLLQEMDREGVDLIAKSLNFNYIYYPISIHSHHQKDFGNAILTKWPILDTEKIILPYASPRGGQKRAAVKAIIDINGTKVAVFNVHLETLWLNQAKRDTQAETAMDNTLGGLDHVIVGGDFNTLTLDSIRRLDKIAKGVGLERVTRGTGPTIASPLLNFTADHIFVRGLSAVGEGKAVNAKASDHYPIWAILK